MKYAMIGILAVVVAAAFVFSVVSAGSLGKASELRTDFGANDGDQMNHGRGHNQTHDNGHNATDNDTDDEPEETNGNVTMVAAGGGWQTVNVSGNISKDTFGVCVKKTSDNMSSGSLVFQARDQNATLHALNFTDVVFDNTTVANMTYVRATGWASFNKTTGYWFKLVLMDMGTRANDLFDLALYQDVDGNGTMDETTPIFHWVFEGLGGGNIWVGSEVED